MTNEEMQALNEAPASLNFYGVSQNGWNLQFTLRDVDEMALLTRFAKFTQHLESKGVTPKPVGKQPAEYSTPPGSPPVTQNQTASTETFDAETLVATVTDGTVYWKVQGGPFSKYGVSVWPEVLQETGFILEDMDPGMKYDLTTYSAHYVRNESGKPKKVVRLEKK